MVLPCKPGHYGGFREMWRREFSSTAPGLLDLFALRREGRAMKPRRTPSSNQVFRLVGGTEDNDLHVRFERDEDGTPTLSSVWELSAEDRAAIAAGANIELTTWGRGTPPVALRTTTERLGK